MKNSQNPQFISSTLKTVASENLVTEDELLNTQDKPLETIFNDKKEQEIQESSQQSE